MRKILVGLLTGVLPFLLALAACEQDYISRAELDAVVSRLLVAEGRYQASLEDIRDRQALPGQRFSRK